MPPQLPNANPQVTVTMDLDTFNKMQGILAKQPYEEISEMIFFFRNQVAEQLNEIQRRQQEEKSGPRLVTGEADASD